MCQKVCLFLYIGENLNLFKEGGAKLTSCANYSLDVVPGSEECSNVCDLTFSLTISASRDPAHFTVQFDDVYIVNELTFDAYMPESDVASAKDADRYNSPFCYKVRAKPIKKTYFMNIVHSSM